MRNILIILVLIFLTACDQSDTDSYEKYLSLPGEISLKAIAQLGSQCLATSDGKLIGDPLSNATVTAIHRSGDLGDMTTATDSAGDARLSLLTGIYDIRIEADGYAPITVAWIYVEPNSATALGNLGLKKEEGTGPPAFNTDTAILLSLMSMIAYAPPALADPRTGDPPSRDWLEGDFVSGQLGDSLPSLNPKNPYVKKLEMVSESDGRDSNEYLNCWKLHSFVQRRSFSYYHHQLFIAFNVETEDIVVSIRGSDDGFDLAGNLDSSITGAKVRWNGRGIKLHDGGDDRPDILRAIHSDWYTAYDGTLGFDGIDDDIEAALTDLMTCNNDDSDEVDGIKFCVHDKSKSRVYFTGHSLGGGMANIAALDFVDFLNDADQGYPRENIVMYSFGAPRIFTEKINPFYNDLVPNGFAIAAKDDLVPHGFGRDRDCYICAAEYHHISNLRVLSTNIIDRSKIKGRYAEIGKTRVESSRGASFGACDPNNAPAVGALRGDYGSNGHDQVQYIKRLEGIVYKSLLPNGNRRGFPDIDVVKKVGVLRLRWRATLLDEMVMGPCDWVALYKTDGPKPTNPNSYECKSVFNAGGWQWVANGAGYRQNGTPPDTYSRYTTCEDPLNDAGKTFWIGYMDGFDRMINTNTYKP